MASQDNSLPPGINQVVIFPKTPEHLKTSTAEEAFNKNGLSQRTIRLLKVCLMMMMIS